MRAGAGTEKSSEPGCLKLLEKAQIKQLSVSCGTREQKLREIQVTGSGGSAKKGQ